MTIADEARANALHCEMVKYAYRQTKDGVVVSFVVHPNDVPAALSISHIGARYMVALVQIGDDEKPIPPAEKEKSSVPARVTPAEPQPDTPRQAGAKPWRDLPPAQQAGMRCAEATFTAFLREQRADDWYESRDDASECVRMICGVASRSELGINHKARVMWNSLDQEYQAWLARERVGA